VNSPQISFPSLKNGKTKFAKTGKLPNLNFRSSSMKFLPQNLSPKQEVKFVFNKNKNMIQASNIVSALGLN